MKNGAKKIALLYFIISIAWIYLSGAALEFLLQNSPPEQKRLAELFKGTGFIILTAFFLYKLIDKYYKNLKKSEEQYKSIFETNPNPMWVYDIKTLNFLNVNNAATIKYEYTKDEFLKMSIFDIRSKEEATRLQEYLVKREETTYNNAGNWFHRTKNGSDITVNIISHDIIYDKHPAKLVVAIDITKEKSYERELEEQQLTLQKINSELQLNINRLELSQKKLYNTQKIARIAGWTYNLDNDSFDFEPEFYTLTNILSYTSGSEITLEKLKDFIHPADFPKIIDFINNFKQERTEGDCSVRIKNKENWDFIKFGAFLTYTSDGHKLLEGFIQDINQLTKTNIENKRLGEIINRVKNLVVITNEKGEIEWVNRAFCEVTGYSIEESVGKKPWDFIKTPDSSRENVEIMKKAISNKKDFNIEIENISKRGHRFWLQIDGSLIYDDKNKHIGYIAIQSEITERKEKENRIKEQNELLYQAAWINSHQVRKPLASILGLVQLMRLSDNEKETREYLKLLEICSNELDDIIKTSVNHISNFKYEGSDD